MKGWLKIITSAVILLYLWSVFFKMFAGIEGNVWFTPPWLALEFLAFGDQTTYKKLLLSGGLIALISIAMVVAGQRQQYLRKLHGDAHWASEDEIKQAGLRAKEGVIIGRTGRFNKRYLIAGENHNIAVVAPPRSGKGISFVIPNNLNWNGSIITLDIRGEAFNATSGFRAKYSDVIVLDFLNEDGHTHRFNPLDIVNKENPITRYSDIDKIATKLWPPESDKGEIWQPEARTLFNGVALMLLDLGSTRFTLGEINRVLLSTQDLRAFFSHVLEEYSDDLDPQSVMALTGFLQKSDKEASGVLTTIKSGLSLWLNPIIDAATSETDFNIRDLRRKRISVYMLIKPSDIARLGKLITLFFEQVVEAMTQSKPDLEKEPNKLLLLMDEFTALPKMTILEKGVAFLSGYNVITMPVIQAFSQLESVYGREGADTFIQTHKYRIVYAQNDEKAAQRVSNALGTRTMKGYSHSHNGGSLSAGSTSQNYIKRELMMANEVMRMPVDKQVILVEASAPIYCYKANFLKDKQFSERITEPVILPKIDLYSFIRSTKTPSIKIEMPVTENRSIPDISEEEYAKMLDEDSLDFI